MGKVALEKGLLSVTRPSDPLGRLGETATVALRCRLALERESAGKGVMGEHTQLSMSVCVWWGWGTDDKAGS